MIVSFDGDIPYLTTEQMIEVDRSMIEDYRISLLQMMENAGRNLAHLARERFLANDPSGRRVVVLVGTGGNGGGALVCARRLHGYGAEVQVLTTRPGEAFSGVPARQLGTLRYMGIPVDAYGTAVEEPHADLLIDGLIGYSLDGEPRGRAADLIRWANAYAAPVVSLDVPSGMESTLGRVFDPVIRAAATMTLALPKVGLRTEGIEAIVGELYLADIGVPPGLYRNEGLGFEVGAIFARSDLLRLR